MVRFFEVTLCLIALVILLGYLTPIFYRLAGVQISSDPVQSLSLPINPSSVLSADPS